MSSSYLMAGMRTAPLLRMLGKHTLSPTPRTIGRVIFLLQSSLWSSLFTRLEQVRYGSVVDALPPVEDPVFIVGHWRTGSTFLHQLMQLDPRLAAPTLFQVALPEHFMVSEGFYRPILSAFVGKTRPMDNVRMGMYEPQEDEYALLRLTGFSPLEELIFPSAKRYFLPDARFLPSEEELPAYRESLIRFFTRISYQTKQTVVSKNPFHSFRIPFLAEAFPDARFIHIVRHPRKVIPSTRHLWTVIQRQNVLNRNGYIPDFREIALFLDHTLTTVEEAFLKLPESRKAIVRYEDLERDPVKILRNVYEQLGLPFESSFENAIATFLNREQGYRKHAFSLTSGEKEMIDCLIKKHIDRFAYGEIE